PRNQSLVLLDGGQQVASFASAAVSSIQITVGNNINVVRITDDITQAASIQGGTGTNIFYGGGGPTSLIGGTGAAHKLVAGAGPTALQGGTGASNQLFSGPASNALIAGANGANLLYNVKVNDTSTAGPNDIVVSIPGPVNPNTVTLSASDVGTLLQRAA